MARIDRRKHFYVSAGEGGLVVICVTSLLSALSCVEFYSVVKSFTGKSIVLLHFVAI